MHDAGHSSAASHRDANDNEWVSSVKERKGFWAFFCFAARAENQERLEGERQWRQEE